ncbi:MAG: HAD family hydrolase [Fimbriimonas sp.]
MSLQPELIVLDVAGTTVSDPDFVGGCLKAALLAVDLRPSHEAINAIMGIPKPVAIRQLLAAAGRSDEGADEIHEDFRARMIEFYRTSPDVRQIDGAVDFFRKCRAAGIKVALDTGFSRDILDVILERLNWGPDLLDTTVTADEVAQGRPYPDLVFEAMRRCGVNSVEKVAKVGDTASDLNEGTAAGCGWVIGVTHGTHSREELVGHPHTDIVTGFDDLGKLFGF